MLASPGGHCPFEEWYRALRDPEARIAVRRRLARVRSGNLGDAKSIGQGLYELRLDTGPGYRVYFAIAGGSVVLLRAGDKSSQRRDIAKAEAMWEAYGDECEGLQRDLRP